MNRPLSTQVPQINRLSPSDADMLETLYLRIAKRSKRNCLRTKYYDHKQGLKDLGIAIPPHMKQVETVVGWPAKAVDAMNRRIRLEGFTRADGGDPDELGLAALDEANRMTSLRPKLTSQSLIHSTSFGFVTMGDVEAGEPEVLITGSSAESATGLWNSRMNTLTAALSIVDRDNAGRATHMVMYLPNRAIIMRKDGNRWDVRQSVHDLGIPVEQFPYNPTLDRPFGRSRITRPMMAITDSAVRTMLRLEVSAEFYNAPRAALLGADVDAFTDKNGNPMTGWQILMGEFLTLTRDEDGELPKIHEFKQQTMQPNVEQMRLYAQQFSAESSLPLRQLGIVGDNPESGDAIFEANNELNLEIDTWQESELGPAWKRLYTKALRVLDDSPAARAQYAGLQPRWRNKEMATQAANADAFLKYASVITDLAETEVGLKKAGFSPVEIDQLRAERRYLAGRRTLEAIAARPTGAE